LFGFMVGVVGWVRCFGGGFDWLCICVLFWVW